MNMQGMPPPSPTMPMHKGGGMHMTFFWGHHVQILFSGWPGDRGIGMYIFSLFFVFVIAALVECLSFFPLRRLQQNSSNRRVSNGLILTALSVVRTALSYLVMLAVMSFNVGVLLAAVAGHGVGFVVFGSGIFRRGGCEAGGDGVQQSGVHGNGMVLPTKC